MNLVIKIALGVFLGGLALAGAAYIVEQQPWKSAQSCATNIAGRQMCGDDLVAFCERRYDPSLNGDTCRPALEGAGRDPATVRRRVKRAEQLALYGRRTRMAGGFGDELWLAAAPDELGVRVAVDEDPRVGEYDIPSAGSRYVAARVTLENQSRRTVTVSPASSMRMIDNRGHQAEPTIVSAGPCSQSFDDVELTPGDRRRGCVVFEISAGADVERVQYDLQGSDGTDEALGQWKHGPDPATS